MNLKDIRELILKELIKRDIKVYIFPEMVCGSRCGSWYRWLSKQTDSVKMKSLERMIDYLDLEIIVRPKINKSKHKKKRSK